MGKEKEMKGRKEVKAANFAILKGAPIKRSSVIAVILTKSSTILKLKFPVFFRFFPCFASYFSCPCHGIPIYALDFTLTNFS